MTTEEKEKQDELLKAFTQLVNEVQAWCDAVDNDASWDGWDSHFKDIKWESLPKYRNLLKQFAVVT